ncbi:trypsin-like peptidase domain-containing protein [Nocardiopsis sp. RSe5-2]|uniref:Trypsin-like peptidase domain-containing protein n=1 Tax=Nocardiopsis endophytica TaxID=3018445 RepID=A0ABT4TZV5_9ACTN|nr:trypsin-like peptidase domain-containing protein [Nocardiopsis endophytica]MDA2809637.1 trypsin-like peptidase domain-containing protein [Nocardiopsis endophytica]
MSVHPWALRILARVQDRDRAIGTGVLLPGGRALTCAHVVDRLREGETVAVDSPSYIRQAWSTAAAVERSLGGDGIDAALLRLESPAPAPMRGAPLRRLGPSASSERPVRTCGYPRNGAVSIWSDHVLMGRGGRPGLLQLGRRAGSEPIAVGCSGSGVLDKATGAVIGLVTSSYGREDADPRTSFMLPADAVLDALPELGSAEAGVLADAADAQWDDEDLLPVKERNEALRLLSGVRPGRMETLVRLAAPGGEYADQAHDAAGALLRLLDHNAGASGVPPYLIFADLVLADAEAGGTRSSGPVPDVRELRAWVEAQTARIERHGAEEARVVLADTRTAVSAVGGDCHVLVRIERYGDRDDGELRHVTAWRSGPRRWDPERVVNVIVHADELAARAAGAVAEAEEGWLAQQDGDLLVEVALPVEFLDLEVESWPYPVAGGDGGAAPHTAALGDERDVVVRGLTGPRTGWKAWQARWAPLNASARPRVHWVPVDTGREDGWRKRIHSALGADTGSSLAVLGPGIATEAGRAALGSALALGYPFLVWDRCGPLDRSFLDHLEEAMPTRPGVPGALSVRQAISHLRRSGRSADDGGAPPWRPVLLHEDLHRPVPSIAADPRDHR